MEQTQQQFIQVDLVHNEELEKVEEFEQLVGYRAAIFEQQGFFLKFSQIFEDCSKESQENMILTYWY